MAYISEDAKWYIGDIILEFVIEGDKRNVVHFNSVLLEANSPEDAYRKAIDLGKSQKCKYLNTEGKAVKVRFRGLRDLYVIHDKLEHGAELIYHQKTGISESAIKDLIRPKRELGVFAEIEVQRDIPNYLPDRVWKGIQAHFGFRD